MIEIIRKLIIQESVLSEYLIENSKNIRKNAFNIKSDVEKNNKNYGDPHYSLLSYLKCFEDPVESDKPDWLYYKKIDLFSSNMDIKDDVVLVEMRMFNNILSNFLNSLNNKKLTESMTNGSCNRLANKFEPHLTFFTVETLNILINLYDAQKIRKSSSKLIGGITRKMKSNNKKKSRKSREPTRGKP